MGTTRLDAHESDHQMIDTSISTSGWVTEQDQEHAANAVSASLADIDEPVRRCVLRLEHATDPHHTRLATARFTVDVDGRRVVAHAEEDDLRGAIDRAAKRLHEQLRRHLDRLQDERRHGESLAHAELDAHAARRWPIVERADRELIDRHPFGPAESTVDEARFDLDALGYDFHPFVETFSGADAVIRKVEDGVQVQFTGGELDALASELGDDVVTDPRPVPHLSVDQARELLELGELDHVFFRDTASDRGAVVYRRYDGHDGLILLGT